MMNLTKLVSENVSLLLYFVAIMYFVVTVIVQVIKNVGIFKNIPTNLVVLVLSILLTVLAYTMLLSYYSIAFRWYECVLSFILGIFVAYLCMFGWDKLFDIYTRVFNKDVLK